MNEQYENQHFISNYALRSSINES